MTTDDYFRQVSNGEQPDLTEMTFPVLNSNGEIEYRTFTDFKILSPIERIRELFLEVALNSLKKEMEKEERGWIKTLLSKGERSICRLKI